MSERVFLVSPVAPGDDQAQPAAGVDTGAAATAIRPWSGGRPLRLGLLDNGKFNAAELLDGIATRLQGQLAVASVTRERKASMSSPATDAALDRLAREADLVISAMAD